MPSLHWYGDAHVAGEQQKRDSANTMGVKTQLLGHVIASLAPVTGHEQVPSG